VRYEEDRVAALERLLAELRGDALLGACAAALVLAEPVVALDREAFRFTRELRGAAVGRPTTFEPDGSLFAHARPGFADVRVLDARGRETPWSVLPQPEPTPPRPIRLLNSGRRGATAVALLDLGSRSRIHDRVTLEIPDGDVVGRVQVYGSDDRQTFTKLSTTPIYDIAGATHARCTTVVYPPSDFRFLQLRASGVAGVHGATIGAAARGPALLRRRVRGVDRRDGDRRTVLRLDLGFRKVPVDRLELSARGRYDRPVTISGSNDGRAWFELARGRIARFPDSVPASEIDIAARHRYVRVTIDNGDDAPLAHLTVGAFGRRRTLVVSDRFQPPFRLLYGNARAQPPVYDFERLPRSALGALATGSLGREQLNEAYEPPEDTRSFVARHPDLIQAALALAAVVIAAAGFLALRRRT
jgi:Protein of unknown function (DUF3999)